MTTTPPVLQQEIVRNILPLLTSAEITEYAIKKFKDNHFNPDIIKNLEIILSTFKSNQKTFEQDIQKGIVSKLPPSDPYAASKFVFERAITKQPMGNINFGLAMDENDVLKGYRISIDGIPLDSWCQSRGGNPNDYLIVLSIYFEDLLREMGIEMDNGEFVRMSDGVHIDSKTVLQSLQHDKQHEKLASKLNKEQLLSKEKVLTFERQAITVAPAEKPSEKPSAGPAGT